MATSVERDDDSAAEGAPPDDGGADARQAVLPQRWSDTDQLIFESLLLAAPLPQTRAQTAAAKKLTKQPPQPTTTRKRKRKHRVSEDVRKFHHREVQRRFMARKKEAAAKTKQAVAGLETQFRLLELASEAQALAQENARLRGAVDAAPAAAGQSLEQLKRRLEAETTVVAHCFEPVTSERWRELMAHVAVEVDAQAADPACRSALGVRVLGWSERRQVVEGAAGVKFTFAKFFPHIWAHELLDKTWAKVSTESYASFFNPALYVTLIGRLRRARDCVLFIRSLDGVLAGDVQRSVGEPASWSRALSILRFEPAEGDRGAAPGCTVHSGGVYSNLVTGGVQHWLMEVLFLVLRFESAMIAPIFTLCCGDADADADAQAIDQSAR
ncbi:hypothetical protein PybrP1_003513 [[Pythium] brassicae (nom. inval.)]|nr:hypothetical protein PybrP1_003513 [[Pythium] brassicae (nom. inval.)]